ncbi:hypothetical protein D9M71_263230 [compost metagenome]
MLHGLFQRLDADQRYGIAQGFGQPLGITTQQHHRAAVRRDRSAQGTEIGALAIATGDQHQLAGNIGPQAFDGRQRRTDIGGLGVVVPGHAITLAQPLATVRQANERAQAGKHGIERQADRMPQGQGRQGIGLVVRTADFQLTYRHQVFELERQVFLAVLFAQAEGLEIRFVQAEGPARQAFAHQRPAQSVLAIDHHLPGATENPVLGQVVRRQAAVAVHVVFTDVEHSGHFGIELVGGFQLETG